MKRWYQAQNHLYRNAEELVNAPMNATFNGMEEGLKARTMAVYDELSGANSPDLRVMEVMMIVAFKD